MANTQKLPPVKARIEGEAWAVQPSESRISFRAFIEKVKSAGNKVLEIDENGKRVKIMHEYDVQEVYKCEFCGSFSKIRERVDDHQNRCDFNPQNIKK